MLMVLLIGQAVNDTVIKAAYKGVQFQSWTATGCVKELQVDASRGDGYIYLVAYDGAGNSADIMRFPYKGIFVQGFTNPDNVDSSPSCIYKFIASSSGGTVTLSVLFDDTTRNTPDTVDVFSTSYKGIFVNTVGFPSPTGGYYAIKGFVAGVTSDGLAFLRVDTTADITPIGVGEQGGISSPVRIFNLRAIPLGNGAVRLEYAIPSDGYVQLEIYNVAGRRILSYGRSMKEGWHNVVKFIPRGTYVARLLWNGRVKELKFVNY